MKAATKMCNAKCKVLSIHDREILPDSTGLLVNHVWVCRCCGTKTKVQARKMPAVKIAERQRVREIILSDMAAMTTA